MRSTTLIGAVAISAIAILVFLPSSTGDEIKCPEGKSQCPTDMACIHLKKDTPYCTPLAKDGETCTRFKGNRKGQFYKYPPCKANLFCTRVKEENGKYKYWGMCKKTK